MNLADGFQTLLAADTDFAGSIATFDFGSGDVPAIFTAEPPPETAEGIVCVVLQNGGRPWGTRGKRGGEVSVTVKIWGDKGHSRAALRAAANYAWAALDRSEPTFTGFECCGVWADPPQTITDREGFPGYIVNLRVLVLET